jgi:hypothetical protein
MIQKIQYKYMIQKIQLGEGKILNTRYSRLGSLVRKPNKKL